MTLSWDVTMFFIHVTALVCLISLYRHAPSNLQKVAIGLLIFALGSYAVSYAMQPFNELAETRSVLWRVAIAVEHLGVLMYVFRLWYHEKIDWATTRRARRAADNGGGKGAKWT